MLKYKRPADWIKYNFNGIVQELVEAKSALNAVKMMPYQRTWIENLEKIQLKREIAGTSQIEGADFTERELDEALRETPEKLLTRSQRQAHAAVQTYRWISKLPDDKTIDAGLVCEIHRRIITGADDDHCIPGELRHTDENVLYGNPRHRGVQGGKECSEVFNNFILALKKEYPKHDPIIQALAAHYQCAAMHPFLDGNGRTSRALEALILQRAGLRDICFIPMSNYYYDEKTLYLQSLNESGNNEHDITPFIKFALKGIVLQSQRLLEEIRVNAQKAIFRNVMYDMFGRLITPRKRVIAERQIKILKLLLENEKMDEREIYERVKNSYAYLKTPQKAFVRDIVGLLSLRTIGFLHDEQKKLYFHIRLEWPKEITEPEFDKLFKSLPKAKTYSLF